VKKGVSWISAIIAAVIMLQTLYFKFSGAQESVYIFSQLGMEPWGRWATGVSELIASVLLIIPRSRGIGALLGAGIMGGAIISHLLILGIEVQDDGGLLFVYGLITFFCCIMNMMIHRSQIPIFKKVFD
jgi:hypothetical protein